MVLSLQQKSVHFGVIPHLEAMLTPKSAQDFALDLSLIRTPSLTEFLYARSAIATACRAHDLPSTIDLVCTSYKGECVTFSERFSPDLYYILSCKTCLGSGRTPGTCFATSNSSRKRCSDSEII